MNKIDKLFLPILISLFFVSIVVSYERYIVKKDFIFFTNESDVPAQFKINSYSI